MRLLDEKQERRDDRDRPGEIGAGGAENDPREPQTALAEEPCTWSALLSREMSMPWPT